MDICSSRASLPKKKKTTNKCASTLGDEDNLGVMVPAIQSWSLSYSLLRGVLCTFISWSTLEAICSRLGNPPPMAAAPLD